MALLGYDAPSEVQARAIPALMGQWDVVAEAPSGSGKTLAFAAPALSRVDPDLDETQALVVVHAGVLAEQVAALLEAMAATMPKRPRVACCVGGPREGGAEGRGRVPHIVVGTPGKLQDLCGLLGKRVVLSLRAVRLCVIDEVDAILDRPEFEHQLFGLLKGE